MAGRNTPQDPNYKLYALYGGKATYLAMKKERDYEVANATKFKKPYEESNKNLRAYLNAPGYGLYAKLNAAKQDHNEPLKNSIQKQITDTKNKINLNSTKIYYYDTKIKDAQDKFLKKQVKKDSTTDTGSVFANPGKTQVGTYYFNAPLIASNNFLNKGNLPKMISAGGYPTGDAYTFWGTDYNFDSIGRAINSYTTGGKGTIQMDRQVHNAATKAEAKKQADLNKIKFDDTMYGFKFQYNPTTVNMSWSGMMGANPVYEMINKDPAVPISTNLFTGTISFDIILNRIQDLALLNPDGTSKYGNELYGKGVTVKNEELKDIVQKGTMYDLEYLFKTLHGWVGYTNFTSVLNGKTNDPGWLPVRPVELHLGNKLRYRVRVNNLEVVHKIFSEKMVPILSVVSITCMRYWDGSVGMDNKK